MNLLPKDYSEFDKPEYWEKFFKQRGSKAFEWYGEYPELCGVLHKYIKPKEKLLVIGCGNSQLSANLYDVGYHHIVNIDISDTVIRQMTDANKQRPEMKFLKMDVMNLDVTDGEFSVVLDKGTLDALMVDGSEKVVHDVEKMFDEIDRCLKPMGRYICISLLQEYILNEVLAYFSDKGWALRIHRINTEDSGNGRQEFHMPVFALVFTKFIKNPNLPQILEVCTMEGKNERFTDLGALKGVIKEMQYYAVIRQSLSRRKVTEEQISLSLYSEVSSSPRYTLTIVDSQSRLPNKFAIFLVPQGRETEWMFATDSGRRELSENAGFERLVVVCLDRNHNYKDRDSIQAELSSKVMELAPPSFKQGTKVPFLSLGEEICQRTEKARGHSEMSGDYVIEDVHGNDGATYRRLVFLSNMNTIQSEARLKTSVTKGKKGKGKKTITTIDTSYLACKHHITMVTGISFVTGNLQELIDQSLSILLIGLGGGGLPTYIHNFLPQIEIDVVDIDPSMVTIATEWFGFKADNKLRSHVADGIQYINKEVEKGARHHVIMLDVDSKDVTLGLSCPPKPFVETEFLNQLKTLLTEQGILILNLVARNEDIKKEILDRIKTIFQTIFVKKIDQEVNEVVFAVNNNNLTEGDVRQLMEKNNTFLTWCLSKDGGSVDEDLIKQMISWKVI